VKKGETALRIGFIGTGSMGGMLIRSFVRSGEQDIEVAAFNRTLSKLQQITAHFPNVKQMESAISVAETCDVIFICVKPKNVREVLDAIEPALTSEKFIFSINSVWSLESLEAATPCKVAKIIPSITQEALAGAILTMYGSRLTAEDRDLMSSLLKNISQPIDIREDDVRICSDLASCGPAFFSFLLYSFSSAAVQTGGISREQATELVKYMIYGVGKLLVEEGYSFEEIIQRVSVPGGVTAEGLKVLQPSTEGMFDEVFNATRQKQAQHDSN
jgi:competence protein ComER